MNAAQLHLVLTHLPLFASLFGAALFFAALLGASQELRRASLWLLLLAGLSALPTYLTGRPASNQLIRLMPGMSMDAGDQHAEVAIVALVAALLLGSTALIGLLFFRRTKPQAVWFTILTFCLALVTCGTMLWTVSLGGKIRHSEIDGISGR